MAQNSAKTKIYDKEKYMTSENNMIKNEVFILLADVDGTLRSRDTPIGVAVNSEEEAKRFVSEGKIGYTHSYMKITIFSDLDDALDSIFPNRKY